MSGYNILRLPKSEKFYVNSTNSPLIDYRCTDIKLANKVSKQLSKFLNNGKPILITNLPVRLTNNSDITYQSIFLNTYIGQGDIENIRDGYVIKDAYRVNNGFINFRFTLNEVIIATSTI